MGASRIPEKIEKMMKKMVLLVWLIVCLVFVLGIVFPVLFFYSIQKAYLQEQEIVLNLGKQHIEEFLADKSALLRLAATNQLPDIEFLKKSASSRYKGIPSAEALEYRTFLSKIHQEFPSFRFFALLTAEEAKLLLTEPYEAQEQLTDMQYFMGYNWRRWAQETKRLFSLWNGSGFPEVHVSDVFLSQPGDYPAVSMSVGIPDGEGNLEAILYGNILLDTLSRYVSSLQYGKTGQVYLIDSQGRVVAHPRFGDLKGLGGDKEKQDFYSMENSPIFKNAQKNIYKAGLYADQESGRQILASYAKLESKDWILVVQQDAGEAFSLVQLYVISIIVLVLSSVFGTIAMFSYMAKEAREYSKRHQELELISETDPLTGLLNRRSMLSRVSTFIDEYRRDGIGFVIIMFDIDDFKKINDLNGHVFGDLVLREIAARSLGVLRVDDLLFRWGGEEFLVVIRNADIIRGKGIAEKIRRVIADTPISDGSRSVFVTVTLGVSSYAGTNIEKMIIAADEALYEGKKTGKNKVVAGT